MTTFIFGPFMALIFLLVARWLFKTTIIADELRIMRRLLQVDLEERHPELRNAIHEEIEKIKNGWS
jgi:hypothetical protein